MEVFCSATVISTSSLTAALSNHQVMIFGTVTVGQISIKSISNIFKRLMLNVEGWYKYTPAKTEWTWQGNDYTLKVGFESNLKINEKPLRCLDTGFFTSLLSPERGTRDETGLCSPWDVTSNWENRQFASRFSGPKTALIRPFPLCFFYYIREGNVGVPLTGSWVQAAFSHLVQSELLFSRFEASFLLWVTVLLSFCWDREIRKEIQLLKKFKILFLTELANFPSKKVGRAISCFKMLIWPLLSLHAKDRHCALLESCHRPMVLPILIPHVVGLALSWCDLGRGLKQHLERWTQSPAAVYQVVRRQV